MPSLDKASVNKVDTANNYTLLDAAKTIGVSKKDLSGLLNIGKDLGGVMQLKAKDPTAFVNSVKIINTDAQKFLKTLDPTTINKNLGSVARNVGKLSTILEENPVTAKNIKLIYKIITETVKTFFKLIADITTGNYIGLAEDVIQLFIEAKDIFKLLVQGLKKLQQFVKKDLLPEIKKLKIKLESKEFKDEVDSMRKAVKNDFTSKGAQLKKEAHKIDEWFKKVFKKLHDDLPTVQKKKNIDKNNKTKTEDKDSVVNKFLDDTKDKQISTKSEAVDNTIVKNNPTPDQVVISNSNVKTDSSALAPIASAASHFEEISPLHEPQSIVITNH